MKSITIITRSGEERTVTGPPGLSVMEVIRESGVDELLALCGGCCSCATCHIYVDPATVESLSPMSQDEDDLLDSSEHRTAQSRLSCQLKVDELPGDLQIQIAPED